MKICVAGKDCSADLAGRLAEQQSPAPEPRFLSPQHSALSLKNAKNTAEYQDILLALIRIRRGITTADFAMPRKPGWMGCVLGKVRGFLWKVFRYQHDRMAFQQNVLNELMAGALEFERDQRRREMEELRARVAAMEQGREESR